MLKVPATTGSYDGLIFDLDGTLWDVTHVSAKAWNLGLERLGLSVPAITREDIATVTGLPYEACVAALLPQIPKEKHRLLAATLDAAERELLPRAGGRLYEGAAEALLLLHDRYPLFIVSNCQIWYLDWFLDWSGLRSLFQDWESYGHTGRPKADNIRLIRDRHRLQVAVYIGDTIFDYEAARAAGLNFIHLAHGFGPAADGCVSLAGFKELAAYLLS
jgi:phosphoglycolate phosphatase